MGEWIALGALIVSLLALLWRGAGMRGTDRQRISDLETEMQQVKADIRELGRAVGKVEVIATKLEALDKRLDDRSAEIIRRLEDLREGRSFTPRSQR
jgi:hypothetical protein